MSSGGKGSERVNNLGGKKEPLEATGINVNPVNNTRMDGIEKCMMKHAGEKKCDFSLNIDGDLNVKTNDLTGLFNTTIRRHGTVPPFPSNFQTTISIGLKGGSECSKLIECIKENV